MKWITREHPKIDRVACPWLIARFIDKIPEFIFVPPNEVIEKAKEGGATPYDVEGVELTHDGHLCSFDAFLKKYNLSDPILQELAVIVRGADTAQLDLMPQYAGLLAISLGLSKIFLTIMKCSSTASLFTTHYIPGLNTCGMKNIRGIHRNPG